MTGSSQQRQIILASGSRTRHHMLQAAGVCVAVMPADLDETAVRAGMANETPPAAPIDVARRLAIAKAEGVSRAHANELVIGSDQVLELGGEILSKPADLAAARSALERLSGKTHMLHSAVALAENGTVAWHAVDSARLTMRKLSTSFLDDYIRRGGAGLCVAVGSYQIEGLGIQLFERVEGDHFTILGLPLMSLLAELRKREVILS